MNSFVIRLKMYFFPFLDINIADKIKRNRFSERTMENYEYVL